MGYGLVIAVGGSAFAVLQEIVTGTGPGSEFRVSTPSLLVVYLTAMPVTAMLFGLAFPWIVSGRRRALFLGALASLPLLLAVGLILGVLGTVAGWLGIMTATGLLGGAAGLFLRQVERHRARLGLRS